MFAKNQLGFTLVELSIVMIIIGLLIGGVLKGQQLIENSKINSTISQAKAFQIATNTFRDMYGNLPGDITGAINLIPNCTSSSFCQGGNGDLKIGAAIEYYTDPTSAQPETNQFWKHLALADLLGGIQPQANPATPDWGTTHPRSSLSGGFLAEHTQAPGDLYTSGVSAGYRNWIKLRHNVTGNDGGHAGGGVAELPVTPRIAKIMDTRIDDGMPGSGNVQAHDIGPGADAGCEGLIPYNESFTSGNCIMFFLLETK